MLGTENNSCHGQLPGTQQRLRVKKTDKARPVTATPVGFQPRAGRAGHTPSRPQGVPCFPQAPAPIADLRKTALFTPGGGFPGGGTSVLTPGRSRRTEAVGEAGFPRPCSGDCRSPLRADPRESAPRTLCSLNQRVAVCRTPLRGRGRLQSVENVMGLAEVFSLNGDRRL